MKILIEITLLAIMTFADTESQNQKLMSQYYVNERGTMVRLLFFANQNIYCLSYHKPGELGFCIESSFMIIGDTLQTEKLGQYLIKRNQLLGIDDKKISKGSKYKQVNSIEKFIDYLSSYGIYLDSSGIVVPKRLIGSPDRIKN
jgi:hypothetical protein